MYQYEYEDDALLLLRLLKFFSLHRPEQLKIILRDFKCLDFNFVYEIVFSALTELFLDYESDWDEDTGLETLQLSHPTWNRFLTLSREYCSLSGLPCDSGRQKMETIVDFYLIDAGNSVVNTRFYYEPESVSIRMEMSIDCYEPLMFANSLVDLMSYFEQENEHLETLISSLKSAGSSMSENDEKEAA